jgi:chromosome segregation ATPase
MSTRGELAAEMQKIREKLRELEHTAIELDASIEGVRKQATELGAVANDAKHVQASLRNAITVTLDDLDRVDEQIRRLSI